MNELNAIETALLDTLGNDAELATMVEDRIFSEVAPQGAKCPFVVFIYRSGQDVKGVNKKRLLTHGNYVVKVVGSGQTYDGLSAIAERLDTILEQARPIVDGQRVMFTREQPVGYPETTSGLVFRHLGGLYRVTVDANS